MPRNRGKQGERPTKRKHEQAEADAQKRRASAPSPEDAHRLKDYEKVGPLSIEGVEVSDLPDKGRGDVFTNMGKEAARKLPQNTGGLIGGD
jgi:hypothetical protein